MPLIAPVNEEDLNMQAINVIKKNLLVKAFYMDNLGSPSLLAPYFLRETFSDHMHKIAWYHSYGQEFRDAEIEKQVKIKQVAWGTFYKVM